jgi:hypothetical protein
MEPDFSPESLSTMRLEEMAHVIRQLIDRDFPRLVNLLYRLDVPEQQIRRVLIENPEGDAGMLIAELVAARIAQREKYKDLFRKEDQIPEDEKW